MDLLTTAEFYNALAPMYDTMTDPEKRFIRERPFFHLLTARYRVLTALDAGAGTGFHSLLLSRLGVAVTAVDCSPAMSAELTVKAKKEHVKIECVTADLRELSTKIPRTFDAAFCMGNTMAHMQSPDDILAVLKELSLILLPGGTLFIQVLNYEKIAALRPEILNVSGNGSSSFTRSYTYGSGNGSESAASAPITFSIRRSTHGNQSDARKSDVIRTMLRPVFREELLVLLEGAGFESIKSYGAISLLAFDPEKSTDLLIIAQKS